MKKKEKDTQTITIVLAEEQKTERKTIRALLDSHPDMEVVGEANDGYEAVSLVESLQPDILVINLIITGINGLEVTRKVTDHSLKTRIVVYAIYGDEGYVLETLRAGARSYVLKESLNQELIHAVRESAAGRRYLSPILSERAIQGYIKKSGETIMDSYERLTSREREVLHLVAQGSTSLEIANKLCLSRRTVETHRANLMRKLGLHSRNELLRYALQRGILPMYNGYRKAGESSTRQEPRNRS